MRWAVGMIIGGGVTSIMLKKLLNFMPSYIRALVLCITCLTAPGIEGLRDQFEDWFPRSYVGSYVVSIKLRGIRVGTCVPRSYSTVLVICVVMWYPDSIRYSLIYVVSR